MSIPDDKVARVAGVAGVSVVVGVIAGEEEIAVGKYMCPLQVDKRLLRKVRAIQPLDCGRRRSAT